MKTIIIALNTFVTGLFAGVCLMWWAGYSSPDIRDQMEHGSKYFEQF